MVRHPQQRARLDVVLPGFLGEGWDHAIRLTDEQCTAIIGFKEADIAQNAMSSS